MNSCKRHKQLSSRSLRYRLESRERPIAISGRVAAQHLRMPETSHRLTKAGEERLTSLRSEIHEADFCSFGFGVAGSAEL